MFCVMREKGHSTSLWQALLCICALFLFAASSLESTWAQSEPSQPNEKPETGEVTAKVERGYARLVFSFAHKPAHAINSNSLQGGVLVLKFDRAVDINVNSIVQNLPSYVSNVRRDRDGKSLRFALERSVKVNTAEVNNELYLDLLAEPWTGAPPLLPQYVIDELMRQAQEEERLKQKEEEKKKHAIYLGSVTVTTAEAPTFTRIEFLWPDKVPTSLQREGDQLQVMFDRLGDIKLANVQAHLPRFIESISAAEIDSRMVVSMKVDPMRDVRMFNEGNAVHVDIQGPQRGALQYSANGSVTKDSAPDLSSSGPSATIYGKTPEEDAPQKTSEGVPDLPSKSFAAAAAVPLQVQKKEAETVVKSESPPAKARSEATAAKKESPSAAILLPEGKIIENVGLQLTFPFANETGAAFFQRGHILWLVFSTDQKISTKPIEELLERKLKRIHVDYQGKLAILRLDLDEDALISASTVDTNWLVTFGDKISSEFEPAELKTHIAPDGRYIVNAFMNRAIDIAKVHDPVVGDDLILVLAIGPTIGMVKPQQFVDFTALATLQGAALISHADDLTVRLDDIGFVIERQGSLAVSVTQLPRSTELNGQQLQTTFGFVDFEGWKLGPQDQFNKFKDMLVARAASEEGSNRNAARLDLARFYIAYNLGAEALAMLNLVAQQDPSTERELSFRIIHGVASVLAGRNSDAERDLSDPILDENADVAIWRGFASANRGDWTAARRHLERAQSVAANYPRELQGRIQLVLAKATIKLHDLVNTDALLDEASHLVDDPKNRAEIALLRGRFSESVGRFDTAINFYKQVDPDLYPELGTEAVLRSTSLLERLKMITRNDAIGKLEALSFAWRGDDLELEIYKQLGAYYVRENQFRPAFTAMRNSSLASPDAEISRKLFDDMRVVFTSLFLDGKADEMPTLEALALFYDFRELTPAGHLGDDIIRRLAERLVKVDLLDQAIELLSHQVEHRLSGMQKTEVATELAMIYLMNREPQKALSTLHRTRQTTMPELLEKRRTFIEARALARTGRAELATELLQGNSPDVLRLKADILWEGKSWDLCGASIEKLLGERWKDAKALTDQERADVMRGAVAYGLADNEEGVRRLRSHFSKLMAGTSEAYLFEVASSPIEQQGSEFRALARNLTSIDNLQSFWSSYHQLEGEKKSEPVSEAVPVDKKNPA